MRFEESESGEVFDSEYDMSSEEIFDLISRNPESFWKVSLDLSSAGTYSLRKPGYGFAIQGYDSSTNLKYTEARVDVSVNDDGGDSSRVFPGKSGRGYVGSFAFLYLSWPAHAANKKAYFVIFKSSRFPWIGGNESA